MGRKVTTLGEPTAPTFSYETWRPVNMRNKKLDLPSFDGRVTLLAGPTFLHINSVKARQSEHARALLSAVGGGKRVIFFVI